MKIIISPAKKMRKNEDTIGAAKRPVFCTQAALLCDRIKELSYQELKNLLACNDKIAELNYSRYSKMNTKILTDELESLTPALLAYEGIQYQYMAPQVFSDMQWNYVHENLMILSGFYGILSPMDGVTSYRLEMQARLAVKDAKDLYDFWGSSIYEELVKNDRTILNLASKEYVKIIEKYLEPDVNYVTCVFGELAEGKNGIGVKVKGTFAKMARGEMVRWLSLNQITEIEKVKEFCGLGYQFSSQYSNEYELVFLKEKK